VFLSSSRSKLINLIMVKNSPSVVVPIKNLFPTLY
jgi:hypothetical protein